MMCGKNLSPNPCPVCPFTGHHSGLITSVLFQGLRNAYTSKYRFILFPCPFAPKDRFLSTVLCVLPLSPLHHILKVFPYMYIKSILIQCLQDSVVGAYHGFCNQHPVHSHSGYFQSLASIWLLKTIEPHKVAYNVGVLVFRRDNTSFLGAMLKVWGVYYGGISPLQKLDVWNDMGKKHIT